MITPTNMEMQKRRVIINAFMAVVQVMVTGGGLFLLYKHLIQTIGVEQLGIWSLVLATTSAAGAANPGISASVVKFVARYLAKAEQQTAAEVIQTSVISTGLITGLLLLAAWPLLRWLLALLLTGDNLGRALLILPWALVSLWLTLMAGVLQSALDGCHRANQRSLIAMIGMLVFLLLCWLLAGPQGLKGLAIAQLCQAALILTGCWLALKRNLPALPDLPYFWSRKLFREMLGYSLNFQVISICQVLYEPATKTLLTGFGGLVIVGYYEMASRLILQLRSLLVNANQVLVPAIADLHERRPEEVSLMYRSSCRLMFSIAVPFFAFIIAMAPGISRFWTGRYEPVFVQCVIVLALGWLLNTLAAPAYFAGLGTGDLRWNTISHVVIAVLNLLPGLILGKIFGAGAVIAGWALALAVGASVTVAAYHHIHRLRPGELLSKTEREIGAASLIALLIALLIEYQAGSMLSPVIMVVLSVMVFLAALVVPLWRHPFRRRSLEWLSGRAG